MPTPSPVYRCQTAGCQDDCPSCIARVLELREAFMGGAKALATRFGLGSAMSDEQRASIKARAVLTFPLPKVTRAREVDDPQISGMKWRVDHGEMLCFRPSARCWFPPSCYSLSPSPERVAVWADLFARPTETVDYPGASS